MAAVSAALASTVTALLLVVVMVVTTMAAASVSGAAVAFTDASVAGRLVGLDAVAVAAMLLATVDHVLWPTVVGTTVVDVVVDGAVATELVLVGGDVAKLLADSVATASTMFAAAVVDAISLSLATCDILYV